MRRVIAVFLLNRAQLVDDDLHHETVAAEDGPETLDQLQQLRELIENLVPFEAGQPLELHVQNRLGLNLASG